MKKRGPGLMLIFCLSIIVAGLSSEVRAQAEPFYKGKTIRIMVGSTAEIYSRPAGDHRSEHAGGRIRDSHQPCLQCG